MATIRDVYSLACNAGYINSDEFTESAFGDMLKDENSRRSYYEHVKRLDPDFYSKDYDTFSANVDGMLRGGALSPNADAGNLHAEDANGLRAGMQAGQEQPIEQSSEAALWQRRRQILDEAERERQRRLSEIEQYRADARKEREEHPVRAFFKGLNNSEQNAYYSAKAVSEADAKEYARDKEQLQAVEDELGRRARGSIIPQAQESTKQSEVLTALVRQEQDLSTHQRANLGAAEYLNTKANEILNAGSKFDDSNALANWWEGLKNDLFDRDISGVMGLQRAIRIDNIVEKLNDEEELTNDEQALLNAYFNLAMATEARQFDLSTGYQIGQGTAQSVPFMIDMVISRGMGAATKRGLLKALTKTGFKDVARVEKWLQMAETGGKTTARDIARKASYEGVATPVQTLLMPSSWAQMQEEGTKKRLETGENSISFLDRTRIFTNATKETLTERLGGDVIDWGLGKAVGKMTQPWRLGGKGQFAVNKYIQSPIGETGEEYIGALIDLVRSYNPLYDDESNMQLREGAKEMFTLEGLGKTFGTVLPMSLVGGAANMGELRVRTREMDKAREEIIRQLTSFCGASEEEAQQIMAYTEGASTAKEFAERLDIVGTHLYNTYENMGYDMEKKNEKGEREGMGATLRQSINDYAEHAAKMNGIVEQFSDRYNQLSDEEKAQAKQALEDVREQNARRNMLILAGNTASEEVGQIVNRGNNYLYNVSFADGSLQEGDEAFVVGGNVAVSHRENGEPVFDREASESNVVEVRINHADGTSEVRQVALGELNLLQEPVTAAEWLNERTNSLYREMTAGEEQQEQPEAAARATDAKPKPATVRIAARGTDRQGEPTVMLSEPIEVGGIATTMLPEKDMDGILRSAGYTPTEDGAWVREEAEQTEDEEIQPVGRDEQWGNVYQWATGKVKEAVDFLRKHRSGYLKGVFHRDEIGDIDLAWGNDKAGLQHIIQRHIAEQDDFNSVDEAVEAIKRTVQNGKISQYGDRYIIDDTQYRVIVAKDTNGNWVITAYDNSREKESKQRNHSSATPLVLPSTERASSSDVGLSHQESGGMVPESEGKGSENNPNAQENGQKNVPFAANLAAAPRDEQGRVDYSKIENADELARVATAEMEGDKEMARKWMESRKKAAKERNRRMKHKADETPQAFKEREERMVSLQQEVSRWDNALTALRTIRTEEEQAAYDAEQARLQAEREARKQTEAGAVGKTMAERYAVAPKIDGNAGTITTANGQVLRGHYVLVSADGLTPSHDARNGFAMSDGYPTVEGQSINDRDYKNDPEEQSKVQQIAQQYNGNAIKNMPIVSDEGLVYNGNGRTMAGQLAAQQGTDGAYMQALADNAAQFGFTAAQAASVPNARVVFQTDERLPYNTTTLAMFNATEQQAQKYKLSEEIDENGRQFVLNSQGELPFGRIEGEAGLTEAPILLSEGVITNPTTNDGYGLVHIEARHGDQIRKAGYSSVLDFIEEVAQNYDVIRIGNIRNGRQTYRLQLTDKHNNTLMIELSGDGTYWNINTAGIFKKTYGANNKEIYNRHTTAKQSTETAEASRAGEQSGTQQTPSMNAPISEIPAGKGTKKSSTDQTKSQKNAENLQNASENGEKAGEQEIQETQPAAASTQGSEGKTVTGMAASEIVKQIEADAEEAEEIELTPENWYAQFGENGMVETPIGKVKMGENQYLKLAQKGRDGKLGMIKPTLERPSIIIEDKSKANDSQETERDSSYIFVKAFIGKSGKRIYYFTSVTVRKDGQEVVVSNQEKTSKRISKLIQQGKLTWINTNSIPHPTPRVEGSVLLNGSRKPTNADNQPTVLGINPYRTKDDSSSADKGTKKSSTDQTKSQKNAEKVENASENGEKAGGEQHTAADLRRERERIIRQETGKDGTSAYDESVELVDFNEESDLYMEAETILNELMGGKGDVMSVEYEKWYKAHSDKGYGVPSLSSIIDEIERRQKTRETERINEQFNRELQQQIDGTLPKGHIYQLGMPSGILLACGFPDMPIELSSTNLAEHAKKTHHPFELGDARGIVSALQHPIAVFAYGDKTKSQNVIVEIQKDGRNFLVGVHFNQNRRGLEVSDIRGIFPKDNAEWLNWINQGKALYLDKEKIQGLISKQRKNLAEVTYLDLDSAAKVVKNFDNPKLLDEKSEKEKGKTGKDKYSPIELYLLRKRFEEQQEQMHSIHEQIRQLIGGVDSEHYQQADKEKRTEADRLKAEYDKIAQSMSHNDLIALSLDLWDSMQYVQKQINLLETISEGVPETLYKELNYLSDEHTTVGKMLRDFYGDENIYPIATGEDGSARLRVGGTEQSAMTEDQQAAYAVVRGMLEDAGVPVEVLTDEQMTRLAETAGARTDAHAEAIDEVDKRFNEELDAFSKGSMRSSDMFDLGKPSQILLACGLKPSGITMTQSVLKDHMRKHGFTTDDIKNLPSAIGNPILIYEWGTKAKSVVIITDISRGDEKITAAIKLSRNGEQLEINSISSVHSKSIERLVSEMVTEKSDFGKDNLRWVDKKRVLDWFAMVSPLETSQNNQELISAAKVVKNFENPKFSEGKNEKDAEKHGVPLLKESIEEADRRFNEDIERYRRGEMKTNEYLSAGNPSGILRMFMPNLPVIIRQHVLSKASVSKHNVDVSALKNLPSHISHPIFVFQRNDNTLGILTEIRDRDGKNVCVAIELGKTIQSGKDYLEVNDVRSIHGRDIENIILPIVHNNTLRYADKEKGLVWLSSASSNYQQEIDKKDLDLAAKVVKNFENPKFSEGKNEKDAEKHGVQILKESIEEADRRFNEELKQQIDGTLSKGHIYQLGMPSEILVGSGIPNLPIELAASRLLNKSNQENHPFDISEMNGLVKAIQEPVAVFHSATHVGDFVILTNIKHNGKNFVAAIKVNKEKGKVLVNDIRSIHPRTTTNVTTWINEGLMSYAHKSSLSEWLDEKIKTRDYLNSSDPAEVRHSLVSAAKVVKNFENPKFSEGKNEKDAEKHGAQLLKDRNGVVYGAAVGGKIYLNGSHLNPNTPMHEYTHLWDDMVRRENPALWERGKELLKQLPLWDEVVNDPNYANIRDNEDEVASEVHSRLSGEDGAKLLEEMVERAKREGTKSDVAKSVSLKNRIKDWLREMWADIKGTFEKWSNKDLSDLSVEQFARMPLRDLTEGISPKNGSKKQTAAKNAAQRYAAQYADPSDFTEDGKVRSDVSAKVRREREEIERKAKADGTWMKAPNGTPTNLTQEQWITVRTKRFKNWFGDWNAKHEAYIEMPNRLAQWLSKENIEKAKGKSRDEILQEFGNKPQPIAFIPVKFLQYVDKNLTDNRVYSGMGYFIDHAVNHHPNIPAEKYQHIQDVLNNPDEVKAIVDNGNNSIVFIKQIDRYNAVVIEVEKTDDGRIIWHKSFYDQKKKPYANKGKRLYESSSEGGVSPIIRTDESAHDSSLSVLDDDAKVQQKNETTKSFGNFLRPDADFSQIVDENGEPMVVYHGTLADFTIFDRKKNNPTLDGFYFTDREELAKKFAGRKGHVGSYFLNVRKPERNGFDGSGADMKKSEYRDGGIFIKRQTDRYAEKGTKEIIVFSPNQIKSATDNAGTFSTENDDIRFSIIGEKGASGIDKLEKVSTRIDNLQVARQMEHDGNFDKAMTTANLDKMDSEDDSTDMPEAQYDDLGYDSDNLTEAQQLALDAVMAALDNAGVEVDVVSEEIAREEIEKQQSDGNVRLMLQMTEQGTLGLSYHPIAGAKLQKNLQTTKENQEINEKFNKTLAAYTNENADNIKLDCGMPSDALLAAGIPNKKIRLNGEVLRKKANVHGFAINDIKNLPAYLQNPIAVFKGSHEDTFAVLIEMVLNGKNALVAIDVKHAEIQDFILVSSLYDKNKDSIIDWINNGKLLSVDKEKALRYIDTEAPIAPIGNNKGANSAAKVVKNFDTAKSFGKNDGRNAVKHTFEPLQTQDGTVYGYAKDGKIHLTHKGLNPNTPIHEYAHLWAKAMQRNNPQGWQSAVERQKGTPMWDAVVNDPHYQSLADENAIASEVLARYSGKRGAERMETMAKELLAQAETRGEAAKAVSLIQRARKAWQDFWKWVGTNLFGIKEFRTAEEIADRVLYDLLNGTDIRQTGIAQDGRAEFSIQSDETLGEYAHRVAQAHQQKKLEAAFKNKSWAVVLAPNDMQAAQQKADAIADYLTFTFGNEYPLQVLPTTDHLAEQLQTLGVEKKKALEIETFLSGKDRVRGTMIDGTIFVLSSRVGSTSDAKDVYIHERQHVDNEEYDIPEQLMQDVSAEDAVSMLRILKPNAYKAYSEMYLGKGVAGHRMLLDELIAYAVSESMRFAPNNPVQYLRARGITNQQLLNIVGNDSRRNRLGQPNPGTTSQDRRVRASGERGRGASSGMRTSHIIGRDEDNRNQPPLNISDAPTPDADETRSDYVARFKMWYDQQRSLEAEQEYHKALKEARNKTEYAVQHVADRYRPLQKFQEFILSKGGTIRQSEQDADGNLVRTSADAYQDTTLATGRAGYQVQRFKSHQRQDMADAIAAILDSKKLDGMDIRWNNIDTDFTDEEKRKNGTRLTARELIGVYTQAKDCQEAIEHNNIVGGLNALRELADGSEVVHHAMQRNDLKKYGANTDISFYFGETGDSTRNYKGGYGIAHIGAKHGGDAVLRAIKIIANGKIDRYVDGNKTIVLTDGEYEVLLALTRFGEKETWLFNGWKKIENTDGNSEVSTQSDPTQANPTFSREDLGAVLSGAKLQKDFGITKSDGKKNQNNIIPDRGTAGFLRNLQDAAGEPVSHEQVVSMVEDAVPAEMLERLWDTIRAATQFSLDYQLANGMIDQATHARYTRQYYVPERGWRERDLDGREDQYVEGKGTHLNGNPYNAALRKANGRESIASDPFAYIQSIAETTILTTERNKVKQKFLQMLLDNQEIGMQTGAWEIRRAYVVRTTDSNGQAHEVVTYEKPKDENTIVTTVVPESMIAQRTRDERLQHRVAVMRDGQQYIIELQDEALANALNSNFQEAKWLSNSFANKARKGVRYMSAINTQYNPAFAIWNLARDLQIGVINNIAKESAAFNARFVKNIAAVQPVIMQYVWNDHMHKTEQFGSNPELSRYLQEYFESGAQTGFSYMQDIETLGKAFDKMLEGEGAAKRFAKGTAEFLSVATELSELTVRFAEFATARQMGFTTEEAAAKAKEVSVNFDRKGLLGGTFSSLYSFFNATVQGSWNILRGLKNKRARRAYLITAAVYAALGVINTLLNPDDPDDDTFFSDYDRQTNFLIGKIKLPVTHFFRMFFAMGVNTTLWLQGKKTGTQMMYDNVTFVLDEMTPASFMQVHNFANYNPYTDEIEFAPEKYAQAVAPSVISPIVDVALNRDFKGATIHREPFMLSDGNRYKRVAMEKRNTPEIYHDIADGLHRFSGGNPDVKTQGGSTDGWIDLNPNDLQHIVEGYLGGLGSFTGDIISTAVNAVQGEFDPTTVPVVNRAFRPYQQERAYAQQYYLLKNRVEHYEKLLKDQAENDREAYYHSMRSELYRVNTEAQRYIKHLPKPTDDGRQSKEQVKELMKLNVQWNKAQ